MGKVLGIVYRAIATHLTRKAGCTKTTAQAGSVTLIQCFGGALNFVFLHPVEMALAFYVGKSVLILHYRSYGYRAGLSGHQPTICCLPG